MKRCFNLNTINDIKSKVIPMPGSIQSSLNSSRKINNAIPGIDK